MRALILRRVNLIETRLSGPVILGPCSEAAVIRLEGFLARNGYPHHRLDPEEDEGARLLLDRFAAEPWDLPIVLMPDGRILRNPGQKGLARALGIIEPIDPGRIFDVAVVGAGPSGLATAVYAASEGLSVVVLERQAFGGQAGASARIENYLGFPTGISGMALMARAYTQAQKFGAELVIPEDARGMRQAKDDTWELAVTDGDLVRARSVVIASGARYRKLDLPELDRHEGTSVHYWASPLEARLSRGQEVALVGGGNSAGQAAVFLAAHAAKVWVIIRGLSLEAGMSRYLADRIEGLPNVEVVPESEVVSLEGGGGTLEAVEWRHRTAGKPTRRSITQLFLFIGAEPATQWLVGSDVALDERGFVLTGDELGEGHLPMETSQRGVFAVGDVRAGSTKRVASAVGEGAQVVATLHATLSDEAGQPATGPWRATAAAGG